MAPGRTDRPSQRGRGATNRHTRAASARGTSEPRGGRAAKATPTPRGRGGSAAPGDGNASGSRRYAKMPSSERVSSKGQAWQVGEGPQRPDLSGLGLFETGTCADATVICCERQWNVHKTTLISRSTWFYQAMANAGPMMNPTCNLTNEYDPDEVDVMLHTIYANRESSCP